MVDAPSSLSVRVRDLPLITRRAQNRALLARQLLLERSSTHSPADAVEHLVGLQAQTPKDPYYALWSRLEPFDPDALGALLIERRAVRMTLMRATVHLVAAGDAARLRPLVQPSIERSFKGAWGRRIDGVDLGALTAAAEAVLEAAPEPLTGRELAARVMDEHGIAGDPEAIRHAINVHLALVQTPPRGVWGRSGQPKYAPLAAWTEHAGQPTSAAAGQPTSAAAGEPTSTDLDGLVLRYLGAFGPASVADFQKWCGLTRCADAFDRLRPQVVTFRSESGREVFDLPDAPRPAEDTPAPVRFLPEYDNLLLSHADRDHVIPDGATPWMEAIGAGRHVGNVLIDGTLRATWWLDRHDKTAITLVAQPLGPVSRTERSELRAEAKRFAVFAEASGVRIEPS